MPYDIVYEAFEMCYGKVTSDGRGNRMRIWAQVCSGVWSTILGNGFINYSMCLLGGLFRPGETGVFEGDDSHIVGVKPRDLANLVARLNLNWGVTITAIADGASYFLGNFFPTTEEGIVAVPDPMRNIEKFTSLRGVADLEDIRQSWLVNRELLFQEFSDDDLAHQVTLKYGMKHTHAHADVKDLVDFLRSYDCTSESINFTRAPIGKKISRLLNSKTH